MIVDLPEGTTRYCMKCEILAHGDAEAQAMTEKMEKDQWTSAHVHRIEELTAKIIV